MHSSVDHSIVVAAQASHGAISRRQLRDLGLSEAQIKSRIGGLLRRYVRGVYIVGHMDKFAVAAAALLALSELAAVCLWTAAGLHQMPVARSATIHLLAPHGRKRALPGARVHQTRQLGPEDVTVIRGLRCTTAARTICDLAAHLSTTRLQNLIEWTVTEGRMSVEEFQACAAGFIRKGRAGSGALRTLNFELFDDEPYPISKLERLAKALFKSEELLAGFVMQFRPPWYDGLRGAVDFAWPELRLIVEVDGRRWHARNLEREDDNRRDRRAAGHGWLVVRITWQELTRRPGSVLLDLLEIVRVRQPETAA